jgi:hypothetical protein
VRVWQYDPRDDALSDLVEPGDLENRRAVLLAAPEGERVARAWMAVDDYDADEATLLFAASPGDDYASYVGALLSASVEVARQLGFRRLLAHWRGGWASAPGVLAKHGFAEVAPGLWRRVL